MMPQEIGAISYYILSVDPPRSRQCVPETQSLKPRPVESFNEFRCLLLYPAKPLLVAEAASAGFEVAFRPGVR